MNSLYAEKKPVLTFKGTSGGDSSQNTGNRAFQPFGKLHKNASQKIVRLLDKRMSGTDSGSSIMRKKGLDGFDIGEFV